MLQELLNFGIIVYVYLGYVEREAHVIFKK